MDVTRMGTMTMAEVGGFERMWMRSDWGEEKQRLRKMRHVA